MSELIQEIRRLDTPMHPGAGGNSGAVSHFLRLFWRVDLSILPVTPKDLTYQVHKYCIRLTTKYRSLLFNFGLL